METTWNICMHARMQARTHIRKSGVCDLGFPHHLTHLQDVLTTEITSLFQSMHQLSDPA